MQSNIKSSGLYELMKHQVWDYLLNSLKSILRLTHNKVAVAAESTIVGSKWMLRIHPSYTLFTDSFGYFRVKHLGR